MVVKIQTRKDCLEIVRFIFWIILIVCVKQKLAYTSCLASGITEYHWRCIPLSRISVSLCLIYCQKITMFSFFHSVMASVWRVCNILLCKYLENWHFLNTQKIGIFFSYQSKLLKMEKMADRSPAEEAKKVAVTGNNILIELLDFVE